MNTVQILKIFLLVILVNYFYLPISVAGLSSGRLFNTTTTIIATTIIVTKIAKTTKNIIFLILARLTSAGSFSITWSPPLDLS